MGRGISRIDPNPHAEPARKVAQPCRRQRDIVRAAIEVHGRRQRCRVRGRYGGRGLVRRNRVGQRVKRAKANGVGRRRGGHERGNLSGRQAPVPDGEAVHLALEIRLIRPVAAAHEVTGAQHVSRHSADRAGVGGHAHAVFVHRHIAAGIHRDADELPLVQLNHVRRIHIRIVARIGLADIHANIAIVGIAIDHNAVLAGAVADVQNPVEIANRWIDPDADGKAVRQVGQAVGLKGDIIIAAIKARRLVIRRGVGTHDIATGVVRQDGIGQRGGGRTCFSHTATDGGRIAGHGGLHKRNRAGVEQCPALRGRVVGQGHIHQAG